MLFICIPVFNEGTTLGVLLWRIRKVLLDSTRPYEILVFDDGSTDSTREVLHPYEKVLPLTVLESSERRGYGAAVSALLHEVSRRTRYPRRDAVIVMQGDFTEVPESIPELMRRFEGGADIVVAQRNRAGLVGEPRKLATLAGFLTRPLISLPEISDPFSTMRLFRISVVRDMLRAGGDTLITHNECWDANLELLVRAIPHSRKTENIVTDPRYDVRTRTSRVSPYRDAWRLFRTSWSVRKLVTSRAQA